MSATSAWPSGSTSIRRSRPPGPWWARPATWPRSRPGSPAAGGDGRGGSRERRLQPGRDPLPHAHRPAAVPGRHAGRDDPAGPRARPDPAPRAQPAGQPRPRDDRAQVPPKVPRAPLPDGRGPGRGPRGVPPRRSGLGPLDEPPRPGRPAAGRDPSRPGRWRTGACSGSITASPCSSSSARPTGSISRASTARWPYVLIFTVGLCGWAAIFWALRRRGGPIRFVERQLAHVWGAGIVAINLIFLVEWLLGLPVLTLVADDRRDQRHAVHDQGRHPLRRLLPPGRTDVPGDLPHGRVPSLRARSSSASSPRPASSRRA